MGLLLLKSTFFAKFSIKLKQQKETIFNEKLAELQKMNESLKGENDRLTMQILMSEDEKRQNADKNKEELLKLRQEVERPNLEFAY